MKLDALLGALREVESRAQAGPDVERAVMARWPATPQRSPRRGAVTFLLAAASLTLAAALGLQQYSRVPVLLPSLPDAPRYAFAIPVPVSVPAPPVNVRIPVPPAPVAAVAAAEPRDVTVVLGAPLTATEPMRVMRTRLGWSTLAELGLRRPALRLPEPVPVDLFVGEDGVPRAVRIAVRKP